MLRLDLGDLNAIYGRRGEAVQAYKDAVRIYLEEILPRRGHPWVIDGFHLAQIQERAYFGIGEVECEFYDFGAAARAFSLMTTDSTIVHALVHYCREDFREAHRLLSSQIKFFRLGQGRFHYYLHYFLKLIDARIHWIHERFDVASAGFTEVLTVATKLGLPRLQVQALNGLAITHDNLMAAKFAAQSIAIANHAEYRYGRAHAGYYMGIIYASAGLREVATSALRYSEALFAKLGHSAGIDFCRQAKARHHLSWEAATLPQETHPRKREVRRPQEAVGSIVEPGEDARVDVCWLDFWGGSPSGLDDLLRAIGFRQIERIGGLQVWGAPEFPDILLEVLNVDSYPREPVSKMPGWTAKQIDEDRRQTCVPLGMDPYYRCMLYAPASGRPVEVLFDQLSEARSRLYSRFVEIASFPGANVHGEWTLWRRKPLPSRSS